jgi:hypothetical protein
VIEGKEMRMGGRKKKEKKGRIKRIFLNNSCFGVNCGVIGENIQRGEWFGERLPVGGSKCEIKVIRNYFGSYFSSKMIFKAKKI